MRLKALLLILLLLLRGGVAAESGESVAIVYNSKMADSKSVAEYYAAKRGVPANQILGLPLPEIEAISRFEFKELLETPLRRWLESNDFLTFRSQTIPGTNGQSSVHFVVKGAKVKYVVLCYGVPVRILNDPNLKEEGMEKVQAELRRNNAAVDSDLALIPLYDFKPPLTGLLRNPSYGATNAALVHPTNGVLIVTRLDGASAAIAKGLVDKAMMAETNGLWGRAYFDLRNIKEGDYKLGDDWIRNASEVARRAGYDTVKDDLPEVFSPVFPMSQIAFYAGWYDSHASGPFAQPTVEFMPGAFAYHLHSYSAHAIRTTTDWWAGPFVAKGATATMGSVDEPYLSGTPDVGTFFARFIFNGFSFGEAAYASQLGLSWQTTVIGDP
ncbi:MAG: hypothetical protein JWM04_273, partial [Verrucomicrobiales bacterium]|nr:hypothetical protein [Verrucomicrobiales bacterium]